MVGVPGRSKACFSCKQRRVKCDLERPCGQCTRSARECSYQQARIFVHHEGKHKTIYRRSDKEIADGWVGKVVSPTATPSDCHGIHGLDDASPRQDSLAISRPFGVLTALNQQLLAEACDNRPLSVLPTDENVPRPWTYSLSAFAGSNHALNSAPLSCYTAWTGRRNREPYLVEASRRLYIQGLNEVQAAVNDPSSALRDETLAACLGLIMYEALECPDRSRTGYSAHVAGCARIVEMRGASMHQKGAAHTLFLAFRYIALLKDLEHHKPSFLSSHAWTTLPWQHQPKTMYDRLLDLLSLAPEVLQKSDRLQTVPPQLFLPTLLDLAQEVAMTDSKMQTFYDELVASCPGPLYWEVPSRMAIIDETYGTLAVPCRPEDTALHFRDYVTATTLTLYWALLAMSWSGLTDLHTTLIQLSSNNLIPEPLAYVVKSLSLESKDWMDPCRKVCRSVQYCRSEGKGDVGPLQISVPLDIVTTVMRGRPGCEQEYTEAVKIGKEISLKWLRILQFKD